MWRGGHFGQRLRAAEQVDRLLGAAVHRVEHLQLLHAEVVVGLHFGEHFFDRARLGVAARLVEARPTAPTSDSTSIVYCGDAFTFSRVRTFELDLVEALRVHREVAGERAVGFLRERQPTRSRSATTRPPGVAIVGVILRCTSVPLMAAMSPPGSTVRGCRPV